MRTTLRVLAIVLMLGFAGQAGAQHADPAPSPELAYEGRLTESNVLVTGTRPFVFSILDPNGNELWSSGPQTITVTEGLYGVVLGAVGMPAIPFSLTLRANLHLHVMADGVALSPDVSLIPALQSRTSWNVSGPFFGDISGTQQAISVDRLKGTPIDLPAGPSSGQVLTFNGTSWTASTPSASGTQGPTGPQGPAGPAGTTGAMGPQGFPGVAGPAGPQGPVGAPGTNGNGFDFLNAFDASASYAIDDVVTFNGSTYVAIAASTGPNNPNPDTNASAWSVLAQEGAPGAAGAQGATGAAGATGATGAQGLQGVAGPIGPQGPTGAAGTNGSGFDFMNAFNASASYAINDVVTFNGSTYVAIVASSGPNNPTPDMNASAWSVLAQEGAQGAVGAQGTQGAAGPQGLTGSTGATGPQGSAGAAGTTGGIGAQGPAGVAGPQGPAGVAGATGPQGLQGIAGPVGAQGLTGATGTQGSTGAAGASGPQGLQGIAGPIGPQGPTGAAGANGTGFNFRNAFDASASYAINDVVTFNGSTYAAIAASAGPSNPTPDTNASAWNEMAQEGAAGAAGAQGSTGATGATGSQGATGTAGTPGAAGPQGPAGASPFTLDGANAVFTTGSVGIGVDPPSTTAAMDVTSTTQGLLAPRMTTTQRLAIATPANGLIVYDITATSLEVYDNVAAAWNQIADTATTGTVTSVTGTSPISVATGTTTPAITLGTVPVANGGTGATTLTGYLLGSGASAVTASATIPGTAISGDIAGNSGNVSGTVGLGNGGTGAATATAAITNLLPSQGGNGGKFLTTSGTLASWGAAPSGTVTSVSGTSPISVATGTTTPAITLGTVPVADGGTGATTLTGYLLGSGVSALTASATIPGTAISGNISGNAANVTGTVAVASGGTGATTLTGYLLGSGTSAVTASAIIPVASGGTGASTFAQGRILFGTTTTPISSSASLFWDSTNNRLGVGTTTPSYPIDVEVSVAHNFSVPYGFVSSSDVDLGDGTGSAPFSIYASSRMVASEFDAISDARIKNVIGLSDSAADLEILKRLKITDYRYIDVAGKGRQHKKGVIAQDVEKVYPDAVRVTSNFIPNVYAMADGAVYNDTTHELTVTLPKPHDFAAGDVVRIITAEAGTMDKSVAAIINDDTFVLCGIEMPLNQVFVFGKKVDDFRVVDYDQLFNMNISATQQLAAENQDLNARIAALEEAVAALQKQK